MKIARIPTDICLLCKKEFSTRTNSHIVPAPLLEITHGERNKEHSYLFKSDSTDIEEYFGSQHTQQFNTEIKKPLFSYDYILCDNCEKYFGRLETIGVNALKRISIEDNRDRVITKKIVGVDYFEIQNINGATIRLLFYSIIWRIIIQDYIENGSIARPIINTEKTIREKLLLYSKLNDNELKKIQFDDSFRLKVATSLQEKFPFNYFFNSYTTNPYLFTAGRFILILINLEEEINSKTKVLLDNFNPILNQSKEKFKVIIFPDDRFDDIIQSNCNQYIEHLSPDERDELRRKLGDMFDKYNKNGL